MRVQFEANKRKRAPTLADSMSAVKFTDWIGGESESSVEYRVIDATPKDDCAKGGEGPTCASRLKNSTGRTDSSDRTSYSDRWAPLIYVSGTTSSRTYGLPWRCFGCSEVTRPQAARQ